MYCKDSVKIIVRKGLLTVRIADLDSWPPFPDRLSHARSEFDGDVRSQLSTCEVFALQVFAKFCSGINRETKEAGLFLTTWP